MNNKFKKTILLITAFCFLLTFNISFAQTSVQQAQTAVTGFSQTGSSGNVSGVASSAGGCFVGNLAANAVKTSVTSIVGSFSNPTVVPVNDPQANAKESGLAGMPSWDSMAFCLVNSIIEYVGFATVQWINSGFEGNPIFVQDPALFFSTIADIEAGNFLNQLSNGFLCSPFSSPVIVRLAQNYNSDILNRSTCTFTGISGNLDNFINGQSFSWVDWGSYLQPWNNQFGATIYGQIALDQRIASALGTEATLLEWGRGFFSPRDENNNITSPGSLIEQRVNDRLGSPERRLEIADEFDEIVNALVNQLIRVALSEISGDSFGGGGSSYQGSNYYDDYANRLAALEGLNETLNGETRATNGKCGTEVNVCKKGDFRDLDDSITKNKWKCVGEETTEVCSLDTGISKIKTSGIPQMAYIRLCRDDYFGYDSEADFDYDGSCLPTWRMEHEYQYVSEIPYYAPMCRLPVDPNGNLAHQYYTGECVPPKDKNIDEIKENNIFIVKVCDADFGKSNYQYDGSCFPSKDMMFDYASASNIPKYAAFCDIPEGVDPEESQEAKDYYLEKEGQCIPPTEDNIDYIYLYTFGG